MRIALALNHKFVCAEEGGDAVGILHANRSQVGAWETWTVEPQSDGTVAFKTVNGLYLCAEGGGGSDAHANRPVVGAWEKWAVSSPLIDGGTVAFKAINGQHYLATGTDPDATVQVRASLPIFFVITVVEADPVTPVPPAGVGMEAGPLDTYSDASRLEYGFKDAHNHPWFLHGYSVHLLPAIIHKGEDHVAVYKEALSYGANCLIPICQHLSQWKIDHGYLFDPLADELEFQRVMEIMCNTSRDLKIRLAPAILADAQGQSTAQQQRVIDLATEVFANYDLVLPRKGNECYDNGYDPSRLNMNKVLHLCWSHGSYGINNPPIHLGARWAEWEGRRGPYHKAIDDAGAGILELNNGYSGGGQQIGPFHMPVVGIEMPFFADTNPDHVGDQRWTDPAAALQLGLNLGANCAGMGAGTSLGLECKPNGALAAECMRQQFRGARAAFLRKDL